MRLQGFLQQFQATGIDVFHPGGNCGDRLISAGFERLCEQAKVTINNQYHSAFSHEPENWGSGGDTIFIVGCGGYSHTSGAAIPMVIGLKQQYQHLVILPSTFDTGNPEVCRMLQNLDEKDVVFCREQTSYDGVTSLPLPAQVFLDHDTAIYFDYTPWYKGGQDTLYAFRTDGESLNQGHCPPNNNDIMGQPGREYLEALDCLAQYESIHTDRAHGMIAATLMGKQTFAYPNNYFKVQALFDYTVSEYPNAKWSTERRTQ